MRLAVVSLLVSISAGFWLFVPPDVFPLGRPLQIPSIQGRTRHGSPRWRGQVCSRLQIVRASRRRSRMPIECRYIYTSVSGTTPKFDCALPDGERIRVKYGQTPEIHGEVAATHLLTALGFGADDVTMVRRVRCHGCPRWPFRSRQIAGAAASRQLPSGPHRLRRVSRFRMGVCGAARPEEGPGVRQRGRVGIPRAVGRRPLKGRRERRRGGRAQTDGDVPPSLGQQGAEPAAGLHLPAIPTGCESRQTFPDATARSRCFRTSARRSVRGRSISRHGVERPSGPTPRPARSA